MEQETSTASEIKDWIVSIVVAVALAMFIRTFIVELYVVDGPSMRPTLESEQRLVVNKFIYRFHPPEKGDVLVFQYPRDPSRDFIKRVIAVPGDTIEIREGRVITMEFDDVYLVTVYTPNAKRALERLEYRMTWEDAFRAFLLDLRAKKPVVVCGDLNVAHTEIDLKNPKSNRRNAGFTDEERGKFTELLDAGFVDTFRALYPDLTGAYTWWSYLRHARETNAGWRIDYFLVSEELRDRIAAAEIHADVFGSDHCPVSLTLK